jgi:hypothetical protein
MRPRRKFRSCGCSRDESFTKCIKTGFDFIHSPAGSVLHGDLFLCRLHMGLTITGFTSTGREVMLPADIAEDADTSIYRGTITQRDRESTAWMKTNPGGVIELVESDCEYIEKWEGDLGPYEIPMDSAKTFGSAVR